PSTTAAVLVQVFGGGAALAGAGTKLRSSKVIARMAAPSGKHRCTTGKGRGLFPSGRASDSRRHFACSARAGVLVMRFCRPPSSHHKPTGGETDALASR